MMRLGSIILLCGLLAFVGAAPDRLRPARNRSDAFSAIHDRRIESLHFDGVLACNAIAHIAALANVHIDVRWARPGEGGVTPGTKIWLTIDDVSLSQTMDALVDALNESVGRRDRLMTYDLRDNAIVIAAVPDLLNQLFVYDVRDLAVAGDNPPDMSDLLAPLQSYGWWDKTTTCCGHPSPGFLGVLHIPRVHAQIRKYLNALRQARPDGTGPSLAAASCWANHAAALEMRIYDVRDISGRFEWNFWDWMGERDLDPQPQWIGGTEGVRMALSYARFATNELSVAAAQSFSVPGRLVVCQTPPNQKKVRDFLAMLRAGGGENIRGLRVKTARRH